MRGIYLSAWNPETVKHHGIERPEWTADMRSEEYSAKLDEYSNALDAVEEYALFGGIWVVKGYTNNDERVTLTSSDTPVTAGEYTIIPKPWEVTIDTWIDKKYW